MVRRTVLAAVVLLAAGPPARAQLDPEAKKPYLWRVVVSPRPHPLVTRAFRERLKRDVFAALQTGLGAAGAVEVIDLADPDLPRDRWEPLWQQFDDKGFAALESPRDLTGTKTHFLRVEYRDGAYHLEARQYDGFTGLASPQVRAQSVRGAEQVGRAAGILLDRDFGLGGTVEPLPGRKDEVRVVLRGGSLGPVGKLVAAGDVFAVAAVRRTNRPAPVERTATGKVKAPPPGSAQPDGLTSTPRDFTLLRVTDVTPDGTLRCAVLTRYENPMPAAGVVGYRCMKLGTVTARASVRLVTGDGAVFKTASNVRVRASDTGFPDPAAPDPQEVCNFDPGASLFRSGRALANVACVTVAEEGGQVKQFPVPILGDGPITLPFDNKPGTADRAAFERAVLSAAGAASDARLAQTVCFEAVTRLLNKQTKAGNKEALDHARNGFEYADTEYKRLSDELARLKGQLDKSPGAAPVLDQVAQNLDALQKYNRQLGEHVEKIKKVVDRENNPAVAAKEVQAEAINARIAVLLSNGEVEQALAAYDQLALLLPGSPEVKQRRDALAAEWEVKDDAHQKARDYLLKAWPAVATIPDFKDNLDRIRAEVDVCKKRGDKWALRKLLTLFSSARVKLQELAAGLDAGGDADRKLLADAQEVGKKMAALEQELREFVK